MKRWFLSIFVLLLVCCGEKVIEPPENLIPGEKMTDILYDLALINAAKSTNPKILEDHLIEPMQYIYDKYAIDSIQFVKSDVYYASIPAEYAAIYENVSNRLEKEKKEIEDARKKKNEESRINLEQDTVNKKVNTVRKTEQDTIP
ncbi:MAG TPA: DUF4296 domain-containing protein [Eudoraea sp.]|nr:DUF4296 domain-containing protein [Eudoraea sp.]